MLVGCAPIANSVGDSIRKSSRSSQSVRLTHVCLVCPKMYLHSRHWQDGGFMAVVHFRRKNRFSVRQLELKGYLKDVGLTKKRNQYIANLALLEYQGRLTLPGRYLLTVVSLYSGGSRLNLRLNSVDVVKLTYGPP